MRALTQSYSIHSVAATIIGRNEVTAREGIDTSTDATNFNSSTSSRNEVLAREGIDTSLKF